MKFYQTFLLAGLAVAGLWMMQGCTDQSKPEVTQESQSTTSAPPAPVVPAASSPNATEAEHGHKPGAHGGIMISLGRDSYHAEAVFERGGILRIYMLGKDESRVIDVEKQSLKAFAKAEGDTNAVPFTLVPKPQDGDAESRTSQFVGTLPEGLADRSLDITIPNLVISGERFRLGFKSNDSDHDTGMPDKVADAEERALYLTPGGIYTEADIQANGNVTASLKFKGLKSSHDMFPQPGDKICPVTETKANPQFTWIVGGKPYEFCCPPCVDEFVKMAKQSPDEIQPPGDYVKAK
ncbi:hypothetical protein [Lacunimicrobium album]